VVIKEAVVLLFLLSVQVVASAQNNCTLKFSGTVVTEKGETLAGASLVMQKPGRGEVSDRKGKFLFSDLCPGEYEVSVQYLGYKTIRFRFTAAENTYQEFRMEPEITELKEVVIKDAVMNTEKAQNFTVLQEKQLAESAGKTLGESLKEITGVNSIQAGPGIFKPVIHGVHSQRVLILNYGIRQEGQQWGAEHAPEIDPFVASNIVVIKDASAIKYGTDALGGVIVVNPAPLPESAGLGGSINTIVQSNGRSGTISGLVEGGIKNQEGWGWRLQGTAKRAGDFSSPDYMLTNTGIKELNFSASTGYHKENAGVEVFFSHFQTELGILKGTAIGNLEDLVNAMEREPPQYTSGFSYTISEPRQEVSHNLLKLNGHIDTHNGDWRVQYGFQNNNRREYDIRMAGLSSIPAIDLVLNTHTLETEWESNNSEKHITGFGITGMLQENNNIPGTQRIPFIPDFNNLSAGLFGVSKLIFKNVVADFGARYDYRYYNVAGYDYKNTLYKSSLQFNNVSATAGATFSLRKQQSLSVNLSTSWRPPHVAELYSLGTHQSAAAIEYGLLLNDSTNEVMEIEDVPFQIEQALKWVSTYQRSGAKFDFEASAYVNYIFNYTYLRPTGITQNIRGTYPYFRYTQTDALFVGADLSATWRVSPMWRITPKATLLRASDVRHDDYLVNIPSNKFEVALRYEDPTLLSLRNFYVESKVKWVAQQHRAPRTITPREFNDAILEDTDPLQGSSSNFDFMDAPDAYWLINVAMGVSADMGKARYDFRLAAENQLNTEYREYTNRFRYYADDLGTNFIFSIKCTF